MRPLHLMFTNIHNWCFLFCLEKWPSLDESVSLCIYLLTVACNREMQTFFLFVVGGKNISGSGQVLGYGPGSPDLYCSYLRARASLSESAPPQPPVDPTPQAPPPSHSTASPHLAYLEKFDGTPAKCKDFLLQCSLFVSQQPVLYTT